MSFLQGFTRWGQGWRMDIAPALQRRIVIIFTAIVLLYTLGIHYYWQHLSALLQARLARNHSPVQVAVMPAQPATCSPVILLSRLSAMDLSRFDISAVHAQGRRVEVWGSLQTPLDWVDCLAQVQPPGWQLIRANSLIERHSRYFFHVLLRC